MSDLITLAVVACAPCLSWVLTRALIKHQKLMDQPGDISMHAKPIPTGGGAAVLATLLPGWGIIALLHHNTAFIPIAAGTVVLAIVSWLDDQRQLPILPRLLAHLIAVILGMMSLSHTALLFDGFLPLWADRLATGLLWLWFLNMYNFMDGMDGLTVIETLSILLGVLLLLMIAHDPRLAILSSYALVMAASVLGFFVFNKHPAKIFLGDIGSVTLGFLLGWLLLDVALSGYRFAILILPGYYWGDATLTLLKRMIRGEKFWEGHKQHAFQRAVQRGLSQQAVVLRILLFNLILVGIAVMTLASTPAMKVKALILASLLTLVFLKTLHKVDSSVKDRA